MNTLKSKWWSEDFYWIIITLLKLSKKITIFLSLFDALDMFPLGKLLFIHHDLTLLSHSL